MTDPLLREDDNQLRAEVEALRLANAAIQDQMGRDAEQTDRLLRTMEAQASALRAANQQQTNLTNFTQRVMDTSNSLMIVLHPDGRIRQVNGDLPSSFRLATFRSRGASSTTGCTPTSCASLLPQLRAFPGTSTHRFSNSCFSPARTPPNIDWHPAPGNIASIGWKRPFSTIHRGRRKRQSSVRPTLRRSSSNRIFCAIARAF